MNDLHVLSLDALINIAHRSNLIDGHRMTEWVVVLTIDDNDLVMNHSNAHVFLQGLICAGIRLQGVSPRTISAKLTEQSDQISLHRTMIGG